MRVILLILMMGPALVSVACGGNIEEVRDSRNDLADEAAALDERSAIRGKLRAGLFAAPAAVAPFDVMDVSYLWPAYSESLLPAIRVDEAARDLLPSREAFAELVAFTDITADRQLKNPVTGRLEKVPVPTDTLGAQPLEAFRVVAFRVDDCGPLSRHHQNAGFEAWRVGRGRKRLERTAKACVPQLRLVLQPTMYWEDVALHVIYSYVESPQTLERDFEQNRHRPDAKILEALVRDLGTLKSHSPRPTDGQPLGPHVGLAAGPGQAAFEGEVLRFIEHYAQRSYVSEIAVLSTNGFDGNDEWIMASMRIDHDQPNALLLNPIHSLKESPLVVGFSARALESSEYERESHSLLKIPDSRLETVVEVANPQRTSASAVDCVTCHSETRALVSMAETTPNALTVLRRAQWPVVAHPGITGAPHPAYLPSGFAADRNFRAFGFFGNRPNVNARVAYESAQVAASMNQRRLGRPNGPGKDCTAAPLALLQCLITNRTEVGLSCFSVENGCR